MNDNLLIISTVLGMASATIANKYIFNFMDPALFTSLRFLIAGIALLAFSLYKTRGGILKTYYQHLAPLTAISVLTTFIPAQLKAYALAHTVSSKVGLIGSLDPFISALYAHFIFKQHLSIRQWVGMFIGFSGAVVLIIAHTRDTSTMLLGQFSLGELAALGWIVSNRLGWMQAQKALKHNWFTARQLNGFIMSMGGLLGLGMFLFMSSTAQQCFTIECSIATCGAILYTLIIGNIFAYNWYATMLKRFSAVFTSLCCLGIPLAMYILGWLLLDEPLYPSFIWSFILVASGIVVFYSERK